MRKFAFAFFLAQIVGCAQVAKDCAADNAYTAPLFGQRIGSVIRFEDRTHGVLFYYLIQSDRDVLLYSEKMGAGTWESKTKAESK